MNKERVEKYINIWLKNINQEDLRELEKDIEMPLISFMTEILENLYAKYSDTISYISVNLDRYSDYIIAPKNGNYSLEDFLLNRLLRNVTTVIYRDESTSYRPESHYAHEWGEVLIDKDRIQTKITDVRHKRKVVAHEFLHGMKTQFYDGDFFNADRYYQMKEELKSIFGSEINDFSRKNNQVNYVYKHCGISYSSIFIRRNLSKYSNLDVKVFDEILNENDAIGVTNDDYKGVSLLAENCYMILNNPESSNAYITNYSFIIERLIDKETLFVGLYIEPEIFYKAFNSLYTSIFQEHFNNDLSALEIFISQLNKIKGNYGDTDEHIKLLNALYSCIDRRYMMSGYNDQIRQKNINCIGNKGLLEVVDGRLQPLSSLAYCDEYNTNRGKLKQ